jgi:ubiquinone/menaquinone biosynthesis C-methylase UbiE
VNRGKIKVILDVGCGPFPKGDVNCDLNPQRVKVQNFVRCDANQLPFRDRSFSIVNCSHVLEHLKEPLKALKDWKRVAKFKVIIRVPNKTLACKGKQHLFTWTKRTLTNFLSLVFDDVKVRYSIRWQPVVPIFERTITNVLNAIFKNELVAVCKV